MSEPTEPDRQPARQPAADGRLEGYQPKRPKPSAPAERPTPTAREGAQTPRSRQGRPPAGRRRTSTPRTFSAAAAGMIAAGALLLGLMLGWVARGGPPKAELVVTTQSVPAVTVTKEVSP